MTTKERVLAAVQRLPDDVSMDDLLSTLFLIRSIEIGIAQADAGDVMDHDEFMAKLERED
jgi:predicted transcriptional regulator